jgi:SAM-dependent methyltransferase
MKNIGFGYVEDTMRGRIVGWMNEIIRKKNLPFEYVDQQIEINYPDGKTRKFPDIVIWERKGSKAACLIEYKPPIGWTPYDFHLIDGAQEKVTYASPQIQYFGTWNTNDFVLWQTFDPEAQSLMDRRKAIYEVVKIKDLKEIDYPDVEQKIKQFLEKFLIDFADIYLEKKIIQKIPIDEFFIYNLHSIIDAFYMPITVEIQNLFKANKKFNKEIIKWFIQQGWMPPTTTEDFERTARQFLYLLIDKILFYNTLKIKLKSLKTITIGEDIKTGEKLKKELQKYLEDAEEISGDYETIFTENFIETMPIPDFIVPNFKIFINGFSKHDFSKIGFKDIQKIYERLIPPIERHKLGQYFTRDDLVDLINGFCIKYPDAKVADFGCGTGTFLIRAYSLLNFMAPKDHKSLLNQLWGVDIAKFPAHLTTINLAARDLSQIQNYPKVLCKDFFDIEIGKKFIFGPKKYKIKTLRKMFKEEEFPILDAVVGNPPYTRQEELEDYIVGYKKKLEEVLRKDWTEKISLGKRASIYAHFFIHGLKFLQDGGRFGYITSNSWLDVDYGKYLQEFFLKKCKIIAIIESKIERWFEDADINTAITILEKCNNEKERNENLVKFVQLKIPLKELIPATDNEKERWNLVNKSVKLIENTDNFYENDKLRIYVKKQKELWDEGYDSEEKQFVGSKWGKYVRAPNIFFKILEKGKNIFVPLNKIAEIKFGIKTGARKFFYLTEDQIKEFDIEKEFWMHKKNQKWAPNYVITSIKESDTILINPNKLKYRVLMVHKDKAKLKRTNVLKYIHLGEEQGFNERPTCASRKRWYDLENVILAPILSPYAGGDRLIVLYNKNHYYANDNLVHITPHFKINSKVLCTILNTTLFWLFSILSGVELTGSVNVVKMNPSYTKKFLIIDPNLLNQKKLLEIYNKFKNVPIKTILKELGTENSEKVSLDKINPIRIKLDNIIFDYLDLTKEERLEVYNAVIDLVMSRIEKSKSVDKKKKFKGVDINALAESVLKEIDVTRLRFPDNYIIECEVKKIDIPKGEPKINSDLKGFFVEIDESKIRCKTQDEAKFIFYCAKNRKSICKIPKDEKILREIVEEYSTIYKEFFRKLTKNLESLIPDKKIRKSVYIELFKKIFGE